MPKYNCNTDYRPNQSVSLCAVLDKTLHKTQALAFTDKNQQFYSQTITSHTLVLESMIKFRLH